MKFAIVALALLGVVAADVSHLNNMYLPPVLAGLAPKQHVSYAQQAQEIPQAPVEEVVDNSVVEAAPAPEFHGQAAAAVAHHVQAASAVAHQVHAHVQEAVAATVEADAPAAPGSDVYESTHQQAEYYTQMSQQQEQEQQQQQVQEPEQQYYTGLVYHQGQEAFEQHAEVAAPQQAAAAVEQHEFHHVEHHAAPQHSAVHVEHHVAVSAPAPVAQEPQADFFAQQSASVSVGSSASSSSGVETQYGANGGYVY